MYIEVKEQQPLNINQTNESFTSIYPNPTEDILNIEISNAVKQGIEIEIFNTTGKVIYKKEYKNIKTHFVEQLDLSGYAKGIYLVKVKQADRVYFGKVVLR